MDIDEEFNTIAEGTLTKAAGVKCSASEYRGGLRQIIEELQTAIAASEECDG